jgi:hypothetical protein
MVLYKHFPMISVKNNIKSFHVYLKGELTMNAKELDLKLTNLCEKDITLCSDEELYVALLSIVEEESKKQIEENDDQDDEVKLPKVETIKLGHEKISVEDKKKCC